MKKYSSRKSKLHTHWNLQTKWTSLWSRDLVTIHSHPQLRLWCLVALFGTNLAYLLLSCFFSRFFWIAHPPILSWMLLMYICTLDWAHHHHQHCHDVGLQVRVLLHNRHLFLPNTFSLLCCQIDLTKSPSLHSREGYGSNGPKGKWKSFHMLCFNFIGAYLGVIFFFIFLNKVYLIYPL